MKEDWLHPVCVHSKGKEKKTKKRRHIWSHLVHQIATSSMEQDSSQLLTQIAFADAISATQLWSCTARPESNKDEIWCSALGSPLMRGEGKLSEKHKTHPTSCLLALAGISSVRRAKGWWWWWVSGGCLLSASVPRACQSNILKQHMQRLCCSQLPGSWHGTWKTSSENNKESLACCARCQ